MVDSTAKEYRTERIFNVMPAISTKNNFAGISIPQNPHMALNNFNSAHQDSYCSESVSLTGPTSNTLKLIKQYNPYGFAAAQACNSQNQMIAISTYYFESLQLIVYDEDCHIISSTPLGAPVMTSTFGAGYFYLNEEDNAVVTAVTRMQCYPTANVTPQEQVFSLTPLWTSDNIVELVTGEPGGNLVYSSLPVWGEENLYWCLLAGAYNFSTNTQNADAYIAVVQIIPDDQVPDNNCRTTLIDMRRFPNQWNNNTVAVDEDAVYFVLNTMVNSTEPADFGTLQCFTYNSFSGQISQRWHYQYESSGILKLGQGNIGSGTTPSLMIDDSGTPSVAITDNASPQMNVVVVNRSTGTLISKTPVFSKMRSCDEASLIAVKDSVVVENNFGHTTDFPRPQLVSNEPGMALVSVDTATTSANVTWSNPFTFFGMSMLARESGIIFGFSGSWMDSISSTAGPEYSVLAVDSYDGRVIWRVPIGRGLPNCHEYAGIYFNYTGNAIYVGTNEYIVCIRDAATYEIMTERKK